MYVVGDSRRLLGPGRNLGSLAPEPRGPIGPDVDLPNRSDSSSLDDFHGTAKAVLRRPLIAHLRGDFLLGRDLAHHVRFIN